MELSQLRYFMAVAQLEHMTRAAEQLHIAQPALTKAIRKLEGELGYALVARKGRNIVLTPAGHALRTLLAEPLDLLDAIPDKLRRVAEQEDHTIRLKVLAASTVVTACVIRYRKAHPECQFDLMLGESGAGADVVVDTCDLRDRVHQGHVFDERVMLAVPRESPLARLESVHLAKAREETFITLAGNRKFSDLCALWCRQAGFTPIRSYEGDSPATIRNLIALGCGVGFWPEKTWGDAGEGIVTLPVLYPSCGRHLVISHVTDTIPNQVTQAFVDTLVQDMHEMLNGKCAKLLYDNA